jgi:nicotinamidase-related amidase
MNNHKPSKETIMQPTGIIKKNAFVFILNAFIIALYLFSVSESYAENNKTIIELWGEAKTPDPVELKGIKLDPTKTAFLILDIEERTCNLKRRPRCVSSVPNIKEFLDHAKKNGVFVVYSLTSKGTPESILSAVAPTGSEPIVKSSVDKFFNTELENILRSRKIESVIISGTTAEGAVIHTATGAAMRGFKVIVPVDGMSAGTLYAEQYTSWHLINAPGSRKRTTLTKFDLIEF